MAELGWAVRTFVVFLLSMGSKMNCQLALRPERLVTKSADEIESFSVNRQVALQTTRRMIIFLAVVALINRILATIRALMIGKGHFRIEVST